MTRASLPAKGSGKDIRRWVDQFWDHSLAAFQAEVERERANKEREGK